MSLIEKELITALRTRDERDCLAARVAAFQEKK